MKNIVDRFEVGDLFLRTPKRKDRQFPDTGVGHQRHIPIRDDQEVGDSCWEAKIQHLSRYRTVEPPKSKTLTVSLVFPDSTKQ